MAERRPIRKQNEVRTVWWEPDAVCLIDHTRRPHTRAVVHCESVEAVAAIRVMQDRQTAGTP
jgi:methylthioribose-1-phosphate isomerase